MATIQHLVFVVSIPIFSSFLTDFLAANQEISPILYHFLQAFIVGEHGDSSVALWSSISVGGVPILGFLENQQIAFSKETLENIHKEVINSAYEVISLKACTSWAIGYSVASLARTILRDQRRIHPVSILAKGFYGIDGDEVFLSLPVQLGRSGVLGVANVHLTDEEAQRLRDSAEIIAQVQSQLNVTNLDIS